MKFTFALLLLLIFNVAFATQTVAVLPPFDGTLSDDENELLTDKMREAALKVLPTNEYLLLKQDVVYKRLGGMENYMKACGEDGCIVNLGKQAQVDYVAQYRAGKLGSKFRITVELYDVSTGALLGMFSDVADNFNSLLALMNKKVPDVFKKIGEQKKETPPPAPTPKPTPAPLASNPEAAAKAAFERGKAANEKKDYDLAIKEYTEAISLDPNENSYYFNRALKYLNNKNDYDKAIADLTEAIRIKPSFDIYYRNRGEAYEKKEDYDKAAADYAEALRIKRDYINYENRGTFYMKIGEYDKALADFSEAVNVKPDNFRYNKRGDCYMARKEYANAIADYEMSLRLKPDQQYTINKLEEARRIAAAMAVPPPKEEPEFLVVPDKKTSDLQDAVDIGLGYKTVERQPERKIDPQVTTEKKSNKSFWLALALDVAGAGLIYYGYLMNDDALNYHRDYASFDSHFMTRAEFDMVESEAWQKVDDAKTKRNVSYILGSILLATGIGVHIWF